MRHDEDYLINEMISDLEVLKAARKFLKGQPAGTRALLVQKGAWVYDRVNRTQQTVEDVTAHKAVDLHYDEEFLYGVPAGTDLASVAKKANAQVWRVVL